MEREDEDLLVLHLVHLILLLDLVAHDALLPGSITFWIPCRKCDVYIFGNCIWDIYCCKCHTQSQILFISAVIRQGLTFLGL